MELHPDGRRFVIASADGTVRVWDLTSLASQLVCDPSGFASDGIEVSPDVLRAARRAAGEVRVWQIERGETSARRLEVTGEASFVAFSPNGRHLVAGSGTNALIWLAENPAALPLVLPHSQVVTGVWFGAESKALITATKEGVQRWDTASGKPIGSTRLIRGVVRAIAPDAASVVTSEGTNALVWDLRPGAPPEPVVLEHALRVSWAAFSPEGRRLLTLGARGNPEAQIPWLWNLGGPAAPSVSLKLAAAERTVRAAFSPDGARFVTGSLDGIARVWDAGTGASLTPGFRHGSPVRDVAFSADGRYVATVAYEDGVRIWDAVAAEPMTPALNYPNIARVRFSPGNRHILATDWFGATQIWPFAAEARSTEDWTFFARLLSNGHLDPRGGMQNLSAWALNESWQTLRARYPSEFTTTKQQAEAWHDEQAALSPEGRGLVRPEFSPGPACRPSARGTALSPAAGDCPGAARTPGWSGRRQAFAAAVHSAARRRHSARAN
jgi:WD40 repeat protein